jgi:predicted PurR-regulated permease PerM
MNKITSRPLVLLVVLASIVVILFGIRGASSVLSPIILAAVITITVLPIPGRQAERGLPGWASLLLSIGLVAAILVLVIVVVLVSVNRLATDLPEYLDCGSEQYEEDVSSVTGTETSMETDGITDGLGEIAQAILATFVDVIVQMGIALLIFFFMLSAAISLPGPARLGLDPDSVFIRRVTVLTEDLRKYISVLTLINLLVGIGDTIFLTILGVDYALLWGLLAWFMGYIPSIGFLIALIPPVLMAYAQYGLQTALVVLVGYILINGGVENFVKPKRMGTKLQISPLVVFLSFLVWGFLLGAFGAILAVPLTMLLLVILENVEGTRPLSALMRFTGGEKEEPPVDETLPQG